MKQFIMPVLLVCSYFNVNSASIDYTMKMQNNQEQSISISLDLDKSESIFQKSLHLSTDHPDLSIENITIETKAQERYLPEFKQNHDMYTEPVTITTTVHSGQNSLQNLDKHLYINFQTYPDLKMEEHAIPVSFDSKSTKGRSNVCTNCPEPEEETVRRSPASQKNKSFLSYIQDLTQNTDSLWLRILFALILGLLLSLTPCIYPMIPITIGILHQSGKKSVWFNFLGSLSYASGLSTTFALLGLLAAFAGASIGTALSNPFFVFFIVLFLGYMSLTMIGVIDMYTPGFMKGGAQMNSKLGPFLSTFLFGLISGTIASPCVSPGLAILLTIVASIGNYAIGFVLLFAFGMGMSTPLMIIATFSNSMNVLPKSGMWMVEIKRMLGFLMFFMCFYYINNVVPFYILIWFIALYTLAVALYYIISAQSSEQDRTLKSFIGVAMLGLTVFLGFKIYESNFVQVQEASGIETPWVTSYDDAMMQAQQENKAVLLDFWANHCSICKAIDHKVFKKESFINGTQDMIVLHKVDCTHSTDEIQKLKEQYKVYAQPAIILVDPNTQEIIKQWTSEPYSMPIKTFIQEIADSL
jgi:thiol:disulfide interchange protein